jgi:predicted nucleic acid-binding protein
MRVVIDTSVLVAAARSRQGASHVLISLLPDARFEPVVSVPLFVEYLAVLLRPENLVGALVRTGRGFSGQLTGRESRAGNLLSLAAYVARRG